MDGEGEVVSRRRGSAMQVTPSRVPVFPPSLDAPCARWGRDVPVTRLAAGCIDVVQPSQAYGAVPSTLRAARLCTRPGVSVSPSICTRSGLRPEASPCGLDTLLCRLTHGAWGMLVWCLVLGLGAWFEQGAGGGRSVATFQVSGPERRALHLVFLFPPR